MRVSLEPSLIEHCAPTLASIKVGSLFSFVSPCWDTLSAETKRLNDQLRLKGVSLRVIRADECRALCYLYREGQLTRLLDDPEVAAFLRARGYISLCVQDALDTLCERLAAQADFPHEVGLFLGYPLSDVIAFIENKGQGCLCCGCWKAYSNACDAQKLFAKFKKCTEIYKRLYLSGRTLHQLTVAV